jgi:hypothetical protein
MNASHRIFSAQQMLGQHYLFVVSDMDLNIHSIKLNLGRTRIISFPQTMKIVKAQPLVLVCHVFSEEDVSKRIYWYFNYNQVIPHSKFFNESTILIDTPQNQDTVCKTLENGSETEVGNIY